MSHLYNSSAPPGVVEPPDVGMAPVAPTEPPTRPGAALHQLLRRMHFYAGVLVGPFLLIAAVSGFFYALVPQAEKVLHAHELRASSSAQRVPLDEQVEAARRTHPDLAVSSVIPGTDGDTTKVLFTDPHAESPSYHPATFVDPATGEVRGKSVLYGSFLAFPERAWLAEVHRRLHLGEGGRLYSEIAASWLAPITLAGLYLWWRQRRSRAMSGTSARGRLLRRHSLLGLGMALGFLFLSVTGLTWSTYAGANVAELRQNLSWTTPQVSTAPPGGVTAHSGGEHAEHQGHNGAAATNASPNASGSFGTSLLTVQAAAQQDGLREPLEITPATQPGTAWVAKETRRSYAIGPNSIAVDPATGVVTDRLAFSSYPLAAKLTDWGIRLHMGFLFGLVNQVLLALLALGLTYITVAGYRMWWKRRPTRGASFLHMGRAPLRGALIDLVRSKPLVMTLTTLLVVAAGCAVPVLGVSLVAFLGLDVLLGRLRRAQRTRPLDLA